MNINTASKLFAYYINSGDEIPNCDCDLFAIEFCADIKKSLNRLENIMQNTSKPLILYGTGKDDVDMSLLPELAKSADRQCIISFATEKTYKKLVPAAINGNHYLVLKTPIDINLAKELNILAVEQGLNKDKIIMNTDIGALGYGYEYGYSMIEKVCLERKDEYLNFPIISDAALEITKTKEAKFNNRTAQMLELTAVTGVAAAGANICTVTSKENIKILKGLL